MVLDSLRPKTQKVLDRISSPFMGIHPNILSLFSFVAAFFAGLFYFFGGYLLLLSFVLVILSGILDAVDGNVARRRKLQSRRGDLIDHFLDRLSDVALVAGISLSAYGSAVLGFFAIEGVLMTSYMGTQSQALGLKRDYSGIMGRADRLVLVMIFALLQFSVPFSFHIFGFGVTPSVILMIIFAIAGNATAISRFRKAYRAL